MSEPQAILSREELAAILDDPRTRAGRDRLAIAETKRPRPFARALTAFAQEQSRLAATVHQRPIRFELIRGTPVPVAEFAANLLPEDRAFALRIPGLQGGGVLVISRPLLFGWLAITFGSPADLDVPIPVRRYTRIELRFLGRLVAELVAQLNRSLDELLPGRCEVGELLDPEVLPEVASPRLYAASFEVTGLGEPAQLRIAFPEAWIDEVERGGATQSESDRLDPENLLAVPVDLRAEVGKAQITLREASELQGGDEIVLEGEADGAVVLRVAGKAKFKAVRGHAGNRAAVRIVSN